MANILKMNMMQYYILVMLFLLQSSCTKDPEEIPENFNFVSVTVDAQEGAYSFEQVGLQPGIKVNFSNA